MKIDVIYTYKSGSDTEHFQIKNSIRLLQKNLQEDLRIIVIGDDPLIEDIEVYPEMNSFKDKFKTLCYATDQALGLVRTDVDYILKMDADIYILKPITIDFLKIPFAHNKNIRKAVVTDLNLYSDYLYSVIDDFKRDGIESPYIHSVHTPYLYEKGLLEAALLRCKNKELYNVEETYSLLKLQNSISSFIPTEENDFFIEKTRPATYFTGSILRIGRPNYDVSLFNKYKDEVFVLNTSSEKVLDERIKNFILNK